MAAHLLSALTQSFLSGPTFPISSLSLLLNWDSFPSSFFPEWPRSEREPQLLSFEVLGSDRFSLFRLSHGHVALTTGGYSHFCLHCFSQVGSPSSLFECFCAVSSIGIFLADADITQVL